MRKHLITLGVIILTTILLVVCNTTPLIIILVYAFLIAFRDTIVDFIDNSFPKS